MGWFKVDTPMDGMDFLFFFSEKQSSDISIFMNKACYKSLKQGAKWFLGSSWWMK